MLISWVLRDLSEISRRGWGGWKQREGHNFLRLRKGRGHEKWAIKRGRVMEMYASDHIEAHPQEEKEVLHLVKKDLGDIGESSCQNQSRPLNAVI